MSIRRLIASFNTGEVSPLLDGRVDNEKYQAGCRQLQNFIARVYGGAFRRPGTLYADEVFDMEEKTRLIAFNFSTTTKFILEFGGGKMRARQDGELVAGVEETIPWTEAQIFQVRHVQLNDVLYLAHPDVAPHKITRVADDNWTVEPIDWTKPPVLDENDTDITITPSALTGAGITLTASAALFDASHVGSSWIIAHRRETSFVEIASPTADIISSEIEILGSWSVRTYGTWDGTLKVQRSLDGGGSWETVRNFRSKADRNVSHDGEQETERARYRLNYDWATTPASPTVAVRFELEALEASISGVVQITAFTSDVLVTATVISDLAAITATKIWNEGAFSEYRGFPSVVGFHEQRLLFAGTYHEPNRIYGSTVDDFENYTRSTDDDGSFAFALAADETHVIQWLVSQSSGLAIGTRGDEWLMTSGSETEPITPTKVQAKRQSRYGSADLPAMSINDVMVFCQRGGRKLREFVYQFETDGYASPDLTLLAEHITQGGIVQMGFSQQPDAILWAVLGNGTLLGMTYARDQEVVAWHRHVTDGEFESVAILYGDGTTTDEVWVTVKRTVDEAVVRYVERLDPAIFENYDDLNRELFVFSDCAKIVTLDPPDTTVTGLEHLEGKTVAVLTDGATHPARVVTDGEIELQEAAATVVVGIPFSSILQPTRTEAPLPTGTAQGRKFRVSRVTLRLWNSLEGHMSDGANRDKIRFRDLGDDMDAPPPLLTGEINQAVEGKHRDSISLILDTNGPQPLNVIAVIPKFEVYGD